MTVIRVSERSQEADGSFGVRVAFGEEAEYELRVADPAGPGTEDLLAWYFEQHLRFPFLDLDQERQAVAQLAAYGQDLFGQVLGGVASHDYRSLREQSFDGCRLEVTGSAVFHLLHWEALRDPDMDAPLAVRLPVTRRVGQLESRFQLPPARATLNILVVTARPFGAGDVGYRTISRPLLDALRQSQLPVTVDLVRPGTWEALREHLASVTGQHQSGWYQVIHFDLHGGFNTFADLDQLHQQGRLLFQAVKAEPFEGRRPFLFFETAQAGKAGPVPAAAVASLLEEHRIPVAVLNACQSAMQSGNEASLALQLVQAGVPAAVGMAYSVTVSAAVQVMPVLYGQLTQGFDPLAALYAARRRLYDYQGRQAYYGQQLDLEDWVLPVAFRQQPVQLRLRPMDDDEQAHFYQRQAAVGSEPATEYGFVGRDLDIQAIERRLLTGPDANELLMQAMAGAGKSTLLAHLAWWWRRTGLAGEVFTFSYEERAWTASQIIRDIRARLLPPVEHVRADLMPGPAQLEQVAQLLRATRHLLIVDNAESITATPAAIPHALEPGEQQQLKTLLARLRGGKTLVLIGSREAEPWLAPGTFDDNTYPLPGLDPQAASTLADRILRRHHADRWLADDAEREALTDLVTLLGGYPLPMTVVLPTLATTAPSTVLADLKTGGTSADPAGQITRAIEYSHGKLDPALQAALLLLASFTNVIPTGPALDYYQDLLNQDPSIQAMNPASLAAAIAETVRVGLATPHPQLAGYVQVLPVLPYFLRTGLHQHDHLQAPIIQAHYQLYTELGPVLHQLLISSGDPQARATGQAATRAEYANLTTALNHGLETGQPIRAVIRPLEEYLDQAKQQPARRKLLDDAIARYPQPNSKGQQIELAVLHNLAGHAALAQYRLDDARTHHQTELQLYQTAGDKEDQAMTYGQLGNVAQEQRRFAEAEAAYKQARDIFLEFDDRHSAARAYHSLGIVAEEQERFAEAEAAYKQALDIFLEFDDRHSAASTYHQLGNVAEEQERFAEAEAAYKQALDIKLEFDDRYSAASTYHQLGIVAQSQERFADAEAAYKQALDIKLEFDDRYSAASTYHQLGRVAQLQERFADAEAAYKQALDIKLEFGDRHSAALTYQQLGMLAQNQERFAEAEAAYKQALDIHMGSDQRQASTTATRLGLVLALSGRHDEAAGILLYAAVSWHQLKGTWDPADLAYLKRERNLIGDDVFKSLVAAKVPPEIQAALTQAINAAADS